MTVCKTVTLILATILLLVGRTSAGIIDLTVDGFEDDSGMARIIFMLGVDGYKGSTPVARVVSVPIKGGVARYTAVDLPVGNYAVIAHHDSNQNNKLDRPYFGLPLESYGYSNGAWSNAGLPSWKEVNFTLGRAPARHQITVQTNAFVSGAKVLSFGIPLLLIGLAFVLLKRRRTR